jgi:hypothetical protein
MKHGSPSNQVMSAVMPLVGAAEAAAALGSALRLQLDATTTAPELCATLDAVLVALGIRDAVKELGPGETTALLGIVEGFLAQAADFVSRPGRNAWNHDDANILTAQGHTSALIAGMLQRFVIPALGDDLTTRMDRPGASFLDVGTGIAALAVSACELWPLVKIVGIDPWQPALALARARVASFGLQDRIELRHTTAEELDDTEQFDLAWLPTFFIPSAALEHAITRVHAALRRGGWATLGLYARPGDPLIDSLADLRTVRQGGSLRTPQELATSLRRAGFTSVGIHHKPEWQLPIVFVAGQRSIEP